MVDDRRPMRGPVPPRARGGDAPAGETAVSCPSRCPDDFEIVAPCRIIKAGGGHVQISAREMEGFPDGSYTWRSSSPKITLSNTDTPTATVTVVGGDEPSDGRDAETITVTRTASGCSPIEKTVNVTVARVTFSQSPNQRYGYDDNDTPDDHSDDHICVKIADYTFVQVDIEGGLVGTDFDFVFEHDIITAEEPLGEASFDLRLNAGFLSTQRDTTLHAKCRCPDDHLFASIGAHVYKERKVHVVVAKIGTNLRFPEADYASHESDENDKLKQGVVKFIMSNFEPDNSVTRVHYDLDSDRAVSYDIANSGGAELDAIRRAMTGTGTKTRVAIVRDMKSYYYLREPISDTDTELIVTAASVYNYDPNFSVTLGTGNRREQVYVLGSTGSTVRVRRTRMGTPPYNYAHDAGEPLEFPAGGWSSDPIIIIEGNVNEETIKWTIPHEVGHIALGLKDVEDVANIMHWQQASSEEAWSDHRLRYCLRTKRHEEGTENQWDTIGRI